jgi:hypothetical protein
MAILALPAFPASQQAGPVAAVPASSAEAVPDAPVPQIVVASAASSIVDSQNGQQAQQPTSDSAAAQSNAGQSSSTQQPDPGADPAPTTSSSGIKNDVTQNCPTTQGSSNTEPCSQKSQREKGQEEVQEQEHQRVEGVVPTFNVTYHHDAVPLTAGQKMNLSLHSALDPFAFASAFLEAGYHEADNDLTGFPWGPKGFFERTGVAYLDTFDGDILSTGVFPIIFRQDPRYFRLGYGPVKHRVFYSLATNFIAKNDYNGKWGPNYGNLLGNLAAGGISNLYYPSGNSGLGLTISNFAIQIAEGAGGSIFNEFWPDLSRRFLHKDPTHGLDAQARAAEQQKTAGDPPK